MTILERARSRKPVTWLTVIGVLLLPAVIGGVLVAALYNPTERLENMSAAIVNLDEPVTIDGQYTPLGRQLAAGLVEGSDDLDSNLDWVLSNEDDASEGLRDGTYQAVVTIPEAFSAAATSSGQALSGTDETAERATIEVTTAPDALVVDEVITTQVADVAAATLGDMLSEATLSNLLIGFTTMGDQLGDAADGARQLAGGAGEARQGADQLAEGAGQAADGVAQLGDGVSQLATGAAASADGAHQLAGGAAALAQGLRGDGSGTGLADGAQQLAGGATQVADGIGQLDAGLNGNGSQPGLAQGAAGVAQGVNGLRDGLNGLQPGVDALAGLAQSCSPLEPTCAQLKAIVLGDGTATNPGLAAGVTGLADASRQVAPGAQQVSDGLAQMAAGTPQLAAGAQGLAAGAQGLADGAAQSADGADGLASGASELGSGLDQLASGAQQAAAGVPQLHDGVSQLATGTGDLADGLGELTGGATELADGLDRAVESVPSYGEREAQDLASVLADPVGTSGTTDSLFGASAVPLLATAVLWFGALATFLALRAVTARALTSRRASALLAGGALLPAAAIGAAQGALVAGILQAAGGYDVGTFWGLLGVSTLTGVVFAAVHQALVAVFGGAGRWIAAIVGTVALALSIVSTIPSALAAVKAFLPTTPAFDAFLAVVAGTDAGGTAIAGLLIWAVLAFLASTLAVARRRSVSTRALLEPAIA